MMRYRSGLPMVMCVVAGLSGCGFNPLDRFHPSRPPAPAVAQYPVPDDDDRLDWALNEPYAVVVRKSCRTLDVYRYGVRIRSFPAVFGLNNHGRKLYEGDLRTPIGLYAIVDKRPHARWGDFLLLDYPNLQDLHRYWLAVESGDIPRAGDRYAGVGGAVGIHGTDKPTLNEKGVDWTWGCISVSNHDIHDLAGLLPVGTLVLIDD
jgi:murein L,D-transpeptidase YafK